MLTPIPCSSYPRIGRVPIIRIRISRKLLELTHINLRQLRTTQTPNNARDLIIQHAQRLRDIGKQALQDIRRALLQGLVSETLQIIPLEQSLRVEDAAGEIADVDASKGVGGASIAADGEEFGVLSDVGQQVGLEEGDGVLVADGAAVPVFRDAFLPWVVDEGAGRVAGDGEEGFQHVLVQGSLGVLGGLVGHEAVDECVGRLGNDRAGEGAVEEVGVLGDRLLESVAPVLEEDVEIVVRCRGVRLKRVKGFEL